MIVLSGTSPSLKTIIPRNPAADSSKVLVVCANAICCFTFGKCKVSSQSSTGHLIGL